ncbi:MAG: twin-arginine translocation signal domain-containing protein [Bacteroidales bacterium]|nr:twin-arginine translocation signal domain-containing protein [Bacteroidales bacterium]
MNLNRRNFLKALGLTGVAVGAGKTLNATSVKKDSDKEFYAILYDSTRCAGCQGCEWECALQHGLPDPDLEDIPEVGKIRKTDENRRTVINVYSTSKGDVYVKNSCKHCNQPACAAACLTQAMHKTEEGPVIWRDRKCMGCRYCMVSCPYDIPKFDYHSSNPDIQKCDMCWDRVKEGKLPACVEGCPAGALSFGLRRDMIAEARKRINDNPELYHDHIYGEHEAGGTSVLYLSPVPFEEIGFNTSVMNKPYPELTKGFLYSVPSIFVLWPAMLLGIQKATSRKNNQTEDENE